MTEERLAEIKERANKAAIGDWVYDMSANEIRCGEYLIAKESDYVEDAMFIIHARQDVPDLVAEVERLEEIAHARYVLNESKQRMIEKQTDEIAELRKALEFYADDTVYIENSQNWFVSEVSEDDGKIAREALAWRNTTRK